MEAQPSPPRARGLIVRDADEVLGDRYDFIFGTLLQGAGNWSGFIGTIVFSLSVLILNYILYKSKLVPRWLSGWGLIGGILFLASGFLPLFGYDERSTIFLLLNAPGGVYEMVYAGWLIVKEFNSSAIASPSLARADP